MVVVGEVHPLHPQNPGDNEPTHAAKQVHSHGAPIILAVDPDQHLSVELKRTDRYNGVQEHLQRTNSAMDRRIRHKDRYGALHSVAEAPTEGRIQRRQSHPIGSRREEVLPGGLDLGFGPEHLDEHVQLQADRQNEQCVAQAAPTRSADIGQQQSEAYIVFLVPTSSRSIRKNTIVTP